MLLSVTCPVCGTSYQVDPNLRGKRMRCPNVICRAVFEVEPSATASVPPAETAAPSWATPPPVRKPRNEPSSPGGSPAVTHPEPPTDIPDDDEVDDMPDAKAPPAAKPPRRLNPLAILAALAVVLAIVGVALLQIFANRRADAEKNLVEQALKAYQNGEFAMAAERYQALQRDVPADKQRYRFLATLSELRDSLDQAHEPAELVAIHEHLGQFVADYQADPLVKEYRADLWDTGLPLTKRLADTAVTHPSADFVRQARASWRLAKRFGPANVAAEDASFEALFRRAEEALDHHTRRANLLSFLKKSAEHIDLDQLQEAERRFKASGLETDAEIAGAHADLRLAHKNAVRYRKIVDDPAPQPPDDLDLIALTPAVSDTARAAGPDLLLALTPTGVLYALDPKHGELRWARRLGIDSRRLPQPLRGGLLAVLGDRRSISLLDRATGRTLWEHPLSSPCVTTPTLAGDRLFVPTLSGRLEEVDPATGKGVGAFEIPQALTEEVALDPDTSRLYVPGNAGYVYVLDLSTNTCAWLLDTEHPADSLVAPLWFAKKSFVLTQAGSGPTIRLRPLPLPGESGLAKEFALAGTRAFPPWRDDGAILVPTADGKLAQVGRNVSGNVDPLFFPLTPALTAVADAGKSSPALVVHADAESIWMLSQGRLHRLQRTFSARTGPGLKIRWPGGIALGEPLHSGQVHLPDSGPPTLFVPFRDPKRPLVSMAAVNGETGKLLWQRQLGSQPVADPMNRNGAIAWIDMGGVFRRDADQIRFIPQPPADHHRLDSIDESWRHLGWTDRTLYIDDLAGSSRTATFPRPVAGSPGIAGTIGVFPLDDGVLARVDLVTGQVVTGPDWRKANLDEVGGAVSVLGDDLFLATDGGGTMIAYRWTNPKEWAEVARLRVTPGRIVGEPLRLTALRLLVRDDADRVRRIDLDAGKPIVRKEWTADAKIVAGPFALGGNFAVVVERHRLAVFDPERDDSLWQHDFPAELVGAPRLVEGRVLVADVDGNLWLLDATTGRNLGSDDRRPIWSSRANLAAAVAPLPLPGGDLFAIWTDGTASVLPMKAWNR